MLRQVCGIEITWWSLVLGPSIELTVVIPMAGPMVEIYIGGSGEGGGAGALLFPGCSLSLCSLPYLTSSYLNLHFGTQGRLLRLETIPYTQETGDKKASVLGSLTAFSSVSVGGRFPLTSQFTNSHGRHSLWDQH